jgi:hypothetical protein
MDTITEAALIARIQRKLAHEDQRLRKSRGRTDQFNLGEYYVYHWRDNLILEKSVDPEALGRQLGVLSESQTVR